MGNLVFFISLLAQGSSSHTIQKVIRGELTARLVFDVDRGPTLEGEPDMLHLIDYRVPEEGVFNVGEFVQAIGRSCAETARELAHWRHEPASNSCDITALVPARIARLLGLFRYGANCFNTALYVAGLTDRFEVTSDTQLIGSLGQHCVAREDGTPEAGDVAVIWTSEQGRRQPLHAFTYIGADLAFEKPNLGIHEPYRFQTPREVLDQWHVPWALRFLPRRARERLLASWPDGIYAEAYDCSSRTMIW